MRILFLSRWFPYPPDNGSRIRIFHLIKGLAAHHTLDLMPGAADPKGKLEISGDGHGVLFLDMVSLLPKKTWKDHGLRPEIGRAHV